MSGKSSFDQKVRNSIRCKLTSDDYLCMFHHFLKKRKSVDTRKTLPVRLLLNACQRSCWSESRIAQLDCNISFRVLCTVQLFCTAMAKLSSEKTLEASASLPTSLWSWSERFGSAPQQLHKALLARVSGWYRWLALFLVKNSQGMLSCNYLISILRVNERKILKVLSYGIWSYFCHIHSHLNETWK